MQPVQVDDDIQEVVQSRPSPPWPTPATPGDQQQQVAYTMRRTTRSTESYEDQQGYRGGLVDFIYQSMDRNKDVSALIEAQIATANVSEMRPKCGFVPSVTRVARENKHIGSLKQCTLKSPGYSL